MTFKDLGWYALLSLVAGMSGAFVATRAQERDPTAHQTRQWQIDSPGGYSDVLVIDTAGVCLYVAYEKGAIAAVPKTQLPPGVGCQ